MPPASRTARTVRDGPRTFSPAEADQQPDERRKARSAGRRRADLPGDDVLGAAPADPVRGQRDQGREHPGQRDSEHREGGQCCGRTRLPPDHRRGHDGAPAPPPDDRGRRQGPGQQRQHDPGAGQGAPETECGDPGGRGGQAQMPAAETRLPLAGSHLDACVDEEDRHPGRDHERRPAPGPPVAWVPGYRGRAIRAPAAGPSAGARATESPGPARAAPARAAAAPATRPRSPGPGGPGQRRRDARTTARWPR